VKLVHRTDGGEHTVATTVETADGHLSRARGLMFRRSIPDDFALLFRFDDASRRSLHMLFVPFDIDAVWLRDGRVEQVERLSAWTGFDWGAPADAVVELPAGAASAVDPGDELLIEDG